MKTVSVPQLSWDESDTRVHRLLSEGRRTFYSVTTGGPLADVRIQDLTVVQAGRVWRAKEIAEGLYIRGLWRETFG